MNILAIETSCDETACAVVKDGREIISSFVYTQIPEHRIYGGVVPEIASRRHIEKIDWVVEEALKEGNVTFDDIDAIAVTAGPGLVGALLVGVNFAKGLALSLGKPLIPVHHIRGHIAACYLTEKELKPPFLCLVVSGGHSLIVEVNDYTAFEILGRSRDDAAGEAFDKIARALGLGYPGGVQIDRLARIGDDTAFVFPQPKVEGAPLDMSFSGVKTSVVNLIHNAQQKGDSVNTENIAASFEANVCTALLTRLKKAIKQTGHQTVAVVGGVSANTRLRDLLEKLSKEDGFRLFMPPLSLTGDNAAMIGAQAYYEFISGVTAPGNLNAVATIPLNCKCPEDFCV